MLILQYLSLLKGFAIVNIYYCMLTKEEIFIRNMQGKLSVVINVRMFIYLDPNIYEKSFQGS